MESYSKTALLIILLACLYIITGKLGLELAVPPGYATMLWPPSGIALGMLILYGWRLWPGVLIGSFLLNSIVAGVFSFEGRMFALDLAKAATPFLIAAGSTLQAIAGGLLIRLVLGTPLDLKKVSDVFKLFLLGGPVTCVIAATIGTGTLYAYGLLPPDSVLQNWFSWWIGDIFGVVVFLPLVLLFPSDNSVRIRWKGTLFGSLPFLSIVAIIIPLGLTFYLWKLTSEKTYLQASAEFRAMAQDNENALRYRMNSYAHALLGGLAYFQNTRDLTRQSWNNYVSVIPLRENYTGINGIGVIYPVKDNKLESFVASAHKDGAPDFTVHPVTENLPHYIIKYICPEEDNRQAIGLNIGFEEHRRQAAELARDTGNPAITRKVFLVQDKTQSPGFLLLYPVYDEAVRIRTVEQKQAALRAWIYAPFVAQNFLKNLTRAQERLFSLRIYDSGEETPDNLIYASDTDKHHHSAYTIRKKISIMQQEWLIVWDSTKTFEQKSASDEPLIILVWGLFFTGMFALFLTVFSIRRPATLEYLVKEQAYIVPLLVFGVSFCGTLYLGKITKDREEHYIHSLLDESAERISSVIAVDTKEIMLALERLGERWSAAGGTDKKIWNEDTRNYVNDFSSLKTIAWVDKNNDIGRITPLEGLKKQIGLSIANTPEKARMLSEAAKNNRTIVSEPLILTKGYKGLLIYIPVRANGQPDGFVIGALSTQQLFDDLTAKEKLENFDLVVEYKGLPVYASLDSGGLAAASSFDIKKPFTIGDKNFSFTLSPTDDYIKSISGFLPVTIMVVGFLISLLLSITTWAILLSRIRAAYLKEARIAAEAANDAKSLFLSNISHEIRTPLNGVLATAELLEKTPLDKTQEKYLGIIRNAGALLFNLLNDVLDLSKIEMHKLALHETTYDLPKTIQFTADLFKSSAQQKGLQLDVAISPGLPAYVAGDPHRFSQILTNLIGNAIKYTEAGSIQIIASRQDIAGSPYLHVEIRDTGIGIPQASLDVVFDRFTQAHTTKVKIAGTGLGLAICKSLVDMMGGKIGVTSREKEGSTFWFTIPLRARNAPDPEETAQTLPDKTLWAESKILLAEDVEANRIIISDMLLYLGCHVDTASNGQEALERCAGKTYDLIFMDCNMPVMDGYEATRKIRELYEPDLPVVAISAHAFAQDIQKCYEAGMDDYIQKPVKIDDIRKCLAKWLKAGTEKSAPSPGVPPPDETPAAGKNEPRVDFSILEDLAGGSSERQEKLVSLVLKSAATLYEQVKRSFRSKNRTLLHDSAHALKSTAAQAGGNSLSALCAQLEKSSGEEGEQSAAIFTKAMKTRFDDEYKYFKAFLENYLSEVKQSRGQKTGAP